MLSISGISSELNELTFAICRGDLNRVNYLIGDNPLPEGGYSLLCTALEYRRIEIAKLLMRKGANVNHKFKNLTNTPLHFAVIICDIEIVRMLIHRFAHVNATNEGGLTALHYATKANMLDIALLLILHGADINARDNCDRTPLKLAIENGSIHTVAAFVQHGANIKARDWCGSTILHTAVARGDLDIVKLVLTEGVDINDQNKRGESPLYIAIEKKHIEVAKYLLEQGASVHCVSNFRNKYTPLHAACENNLNDIVRLLLHKGADVNAVAKHRLTPIHLAMRSHNYQIIEMLLNHKVNVDTEDEDGKTILHLAVKREDFMMVNQILSRGPDIHNNSNKSALKIAVSRCREGFTVIVEALLRYGFTFAPEDANDSEVLSAVIGKMCPVTLQNMLNTYILVRDLFEPLSIDLKDRLMQVITRLVTCFNVYSIVDRENTALYRALFPNTDDIDCDVESILKVLTLTYEESTANPTIRICLIAFCLAIQNEHKNIIEVLAENCPYVNLKSESGSVLLLFAAEEGIEDICKLLIKRGVDVNINYGSTALHQAATFGHKDIVQFLLAHGARVNSRDKNGSTPLHVCGEVGLQHSEDVCRLLIQAGARVNAKDACGLTPLHRAVMGEDINVTRILLAHDADINVEDRSAATPLHFCAWRGEKEIFELLVESGANVHAKTKDGITALHIAAICNHACVMKILLDLGLDIDSTDKNGNTALHLAILTRQVNATLILIKNSSDVKIINKSNQTAFHVVDDSEFIDRSWIVPSEDGVSSYVDEKHKYYIYIKWKRHALVGHECDDDHCSRTHGVDSTFDIVAQYLIKMQIANMDRGNFENVRVDTDINWPWFREKCWEEIERMKSIKIDNTTVTFYDILTKPVRRLASFARNEDIVREMKLNNYERLFPEYACMIRSNFNKGMKRKQLIDESEKYFRMRLGIYYDVMPRVCIDELFDYFSDTDLMSLKKSYH